MVPSNFRKVPIITLFFLLSFFLEICFPFWRVSITVVLRPWTFRRCYLRPTPVALCPSFLRFTCVSPTSYRHGPWRLAPSHLSVETLPSKTVPRTIILVLRPKWNVGNKYWTKMFFTGGRLFSCLSLYYLRRCHPVKGSRCGVAGSFLKKLRVDSLLYFPRRNSLQ